MNRPIQTALADLREIQGFAVLYLDNRQWLLPQREVRSLAALVEIDQEVQATGSVGAIGLDGEWWPTYCLSGDLQLLPRPPESRLVCVLLNNGADRFGVMCDHVESLAKPPRLFALPACMALPDSPIQALALFQGGLGYVTTAEHLAALIGSLAENTNA